MKQAYQTVLGKKIKGISLLEVMLSLAIIAIILLLATRYFGIASKTNNMNQVSSQIIEIQQGVAQYFNNNNNSFPTSWAEVQPYLSSGTAAGNTPFPGVQFSLTGAGGGAMPTITVTGFTANNADICRNLASRFIKSNASCNGTQLTLNGMVPNE